MAKTHFTQKLSESYNWNFVKNSFDLMFHDQVRPQIGPYATTAHLSCYAQTYGLIWSVSLSNSNNNIIKFGSWVYETLMKGIPESIY